MCPLAPSCHPNTAGCCICERQKQQRHLSRGFRRWIQTFLATVNQTWATPPSFEHVLSQKVGKKLRYLELIKRILYQSIRTRVHREFPVVLLEIESRFRIRLAYIYHKNQICMKIDDYKFRTPELNVFVLFKFFRILY